MLNIYALTGNDIKGEGACALSEALIINRTLTELDLSGEQQKAQEGTEQVNTNGTDKAGNEIKVEGARALSEALKINTKLATLKLQGTEVKKAKAFQDNDFNSSKTTGSRVLDEGVRALCDALKVNKTLQTLKLGCKKIMNKTKKSKDSKSLFTRQTIQFVSKEHAQ